MNIAELLKFRETLWKELDDVARAKGKDYSGVNGDTFKNLKLSELYGVPAEIGILIRVGDKYSRLFELLMRESQKGDGPAISNETIDDNLKDAINYLSYILAIRKEKGK